MTAILRCLLVFAPPLMAGATGAPRYPASLAQFHSDTAVAMLGAAPGAPQTIPDSLIDAASVASIRQRYAADAGFRARYASLMARAERYVGIPEETWLEMLPDRSPAPICDYANLGSSQYLTRCPVTGTLVPEWFEPFDFEHPFRVKLKSNGQYIYERAGDRPSDYSYKPTGKIRLEQWNGKVSELESCENPNVKTTSGPLHFYPENLVWSERLAGILGNWEGGVLPDLSKAYQLTKDERYGRLILFILERLGEILPDMPLGYYNGLDPRTRDEFLQAANTKTPVGKHGWLGPARLNAASTNFRPTVEGYQTYNLCVAFCSIADSSAWGSNPGEAHERRERMKSGLFSELALLFRSYGPYAPVGNGVGMYIPSMAGLGVVLQDRYFFDGFNDVIESFLYNQNYHDGISTEGSLNYAGMVQGTLQIWKNIRAQYQPDYKELHPFITQVGRSKERITSQRGIMSQHGDGPNYAFMAGPLKHGANGRELLQPSEVFGGYGITLLRAGGEGRRMEVFFHHDRAYAHAHEDMLGLQVHYRGVPIINFLGDSRMSNFVDIKQSAQGPISKLRQLDYPSPMRPTDRLTEEIEDMRKRADMPSMWAYILNRSPLTKNSVTVDEYEHSQGRTAWLGGFGYSKEAYGNLTGFRGSDASDSTVPILQVAEAEGRDMLALHYQGVRSYQRRLLAITRPGGEPYLVDLFGVGGGSRQMLLWHSVGEVINSAIGLTEDKQQSNASLESWLNESFPDRRYFLNERTKIDSEYLLRNVSVTSQVPPVWRQTWRLDYAKWAPKTAKPGQSLITQEQWRKQGIVPVDIDVYGIRGNASANDQLVQAVSDYPAMIEENIDRSRIRGMVRFEDALGYAGVMRQNSRRDAVDFIHVLQPYVDSEGGTIKQITKLLSSDNQGTPPGVNGLKIVFSDGSQDIVLSLEKTVSSYKFEGGISFRGRHAVIRLAADGSVTDARMVSGALLTYKGRELLVSKHRDYTGAVSSLEGDVSGDHSRSAILVRTDFDWAAEGGLGALRGQVATVAYNQGRRVEAYTIQSAESAGQGLVRLLLSAGTPFVDTWGRVKSLENPFNDAGGVAAPNEFIGSEGSFEKAGTRHLYGSRLAFPELGLEFTLKGMESRELRVDLEEDIDLGAIGVREGTVYAVYPDYRQAVVKIAMSSALNR